MRLYIVGHVSPDLDAVISPIVYAEFLRRLKRYSEAELIPVVAGDINVETKYILEKFGAKTPLNIEDVEIASTDAFVLCDHNEQAQRHSKIVADQVIEIVDHHKINIGFTSPVRIDVKPFGSTATLIYELFEMYGITPSNLAKSLMLSAILSDTQGLKSSTTTGLDSEVANSISENLKIDVEQLTFEIFKAKSDFTGLTPAELVRKEYKIYDFDGTRVFIDQIETVEPEKIIALKTELLKELDNIKSVENVAQTYLVITDILKVNSHILYTNETEKEIVEAGFTTEGQDGIADIGPKMSRKKDIAPVIEGTAISISKRNTRQEA